MSSDSDKKEAVRIRLEAWPSAAVRSVASGKVDAVQLARKEMIARGLDADGRWVGLEKAREIWRAEPWGI